MPIQSGNLFFESIGYAPGFPADSQFPCNLWAAPDQIPAAGGCPDKQPKFVTGAQGLGCAGGSCSCGGACGMSGLGLFDSGLDLSQWGIAEWGIALVALWGILSMFSAGRRGVQRVRDFGRRRARRSRRRAELKKELQAV